MDIFRVSTLAFLDKKNRAYVIFCAKHPDPGSQFDIATRWLRSLPLPDWLFFFILVHCMGYDGIICSEGKQHIGHCFFQKHWRYWGIFSVYVPEDLRQQGHAKRMVAECLKLAYGKKRIKQVHIGDGGNEYIDRIYKAATAGKLGLPFSLRVGVKAGAVALVRLEENQNLRRLFAENLKKS